MKLIRNIRKGLMHFREDADLSADDTKLLRQFLTADQRELFFKMDPPDQIHSIRVARLCRKSLQYFPDIADSTVMKAALLHDVGKAGGKLGLFFRTFWALARRLLYPLTAHLAERQTPPPTGSLSHKIWLQVNHASLGAEAARKVGTEHTICELIESTGMPRDSHETIEQQILISADGDRIVKPQDTNRTYEQ